MGVVLGAVKRPAKHDTAAAEKGLSAAMRSRDVIV
jgi:hypothetical protein